MSRDYIDDPNEDSAFSLRAIRDAMDELVEEMRAFREVLEIILLTDEQRENLHSKEPA